MEVDIDSLYNIENTEADRRSGIPEYKRRVSRDFLANKVIGTYVKYHENHLGIWLRLPILRFNWAENDYKTLPNEDFPSVYKSYTHLENNTDYILVYFTDFNVGQIILNTSKEDRHVNFEVGHVSTNWVICTNIVAWERIPDIEVYNLLYPPTPDKGYLIDLINTQEI